MNAVTYGSPDHPPFFRPGSIHSAMNFQTEIPELEAELHRVLGMCEEDETALAKSTMPEVDGIFLASLNKLRYELESAFIERRPRGGTKWSV